MRKYLLFSFALLLFVAGDAWAQRTVTGKVTSTLDGLGLPGATVRIQETSEGVITDFDGNYRIDVPGPETVLTFSSVGYETITETVGNRSTIDVSLAEDIKQLEEVVVTAVGIEASKRMLGYTIQEVDGDEVAQAQEANLVDALNSKVAGVNIVSSSGAPGASSSIRIRGNTSITGNNSPLFVVDGVPIDNDEVGNSATDGPSVDGVDNSNRAIDINPNDIASLTVLKGPAATVLYGIRAANGAVIITTKRGEKGMRPTVSFSSNVEVTEVNKLPDMQMEFGQGSNGIYRGPETFEGFSWGPRIGEGNDLQAFDKFESFFVRGVNTDQNISVRGGTEKSTYYFSTGYLNQNGIIPNSEFDRITLKSNLSTDITDKITASISANYINSGGVRMQRGSNLRGIMLGLVRNTPSFDIGNGKEGQDAADDPSSYLFPDGTQRSYRNGIYDNPFWVVNKNYTTDEVNRFFGFGNITYEPFKDLNFSYKLGIDQYSDRRLGRIDLVPVWNPGQIRNDNIYNRNINSDFLISYNKDLSERFMISAVVGHNYFTSEQRINTVIGNTLSQPNFYNIANASDVISSEAVNKRELVGVFGDIKLSYGNFLFVNLSGRNDWSSTLPEDDNSFFYPAVSLGVDLATALGIESSVFSYGKLRASYGQVGNDAPLYATQNYFTQAVGGGDGFIVDGVTTFPFLGNNAFEQDGILGNNELVAELTTTLELGADIRLFDNRLGLDVTYYNSETEDQIIPVDISAATGFINIIRNAGLVKNEGIEAVLNYSPFRDDFRWDINVNFTAYETTVEELAPGIDNILLNGFTSTSSRAVAGEPFGVIYGQGFQKTDDGRLIIGEDGFPLQSSAPFVIGDPNPDFLIGLRNEFAYRDLSFSFLWDFRKGGDVWNGTRGIAEYFGVMQNTADLRGEAGRNVVFEGVVQTEDGTFIENTQQVDLHNNAVGMSVNRWQRYGFGTPGEDNIEDGSWARLRQVRVSYDFSRFLEGSLISRAELSLVGRNLLLFTPYTGVDPETNLTGTSNGFGLDYFNNPATRGYAASLRLTF